MKKTVLVSFFTCIIGIAVGAALLLSALTFNWLPGVRAYISYSPSSSPSVSPAAQESFDSADLLDRAMEVAVLLRDRNWTALASTVHPEDGVTFTPYSNVSESDQTFTGSQVAAFGSDSNLYLWGYYDGVGDPMELTPKEYFDRFVFNADYTEAPYLAVNRVLSRGNSLENVADAYPDGQFVEFYFDMLEEQYEGFDWCALKLVFRPYEDELMLVGVIHSQWTI